ATQSKDWKLGLSILLLCNTTLLSCQNILQIRLLPAKRMGPVLSLQRHSQKKDSRLFCLGMSAEEIFIRCSTSEDKRKAFCGSTLGGASTATKARNEQSCSHS